MKHTGKRILAALAAALFLAGSFPAAAADETHTHQYTDVTVVEPGYVYGGYTFYRCACGDSYTDNPTSPLTQPACAMSGGRVLPGDEITVPVQLLHCAHLQRLSLDLDYNEKRLTLTRAECAAYGTPERRSDKSLFFGTIDPTVQEAVLLLTFTAAATAPNGQNTVSVSGCGVSACPADGGRQIPLTAQSAFVEIHRPPRLTVTAPDGPVYTGDTVQLTVDLENNCGLAGMAFELHYDPQALTLTDVQQNGMFTAGNIIMSGNLSLMPFRILWDDAAAPENHTEIGTLLTLTFAVKDTAAAGTTSVWLTFDPEEMLDVHLDTVEMFTSATTLTLVKHTCGDTDDDGNLDVADIVCLSRYLAGGWNVTVHTRNSDVNGDGILDLKDVVLMRRFLAGGWGVTLV